MKASERRGFLKSLFLLIFLYYCSFAGQANVSEKINIAKNISYCFKESGNPCIAEHKLDIYFPKEKELAPREVLVFIHGGSWAHGDKRLYTMIGRRMAKLGKVAVIINYRLSPKANYNDMLNDCASAINWVYKNIGNFNGDPEKIMVSGHSAGGHLAACLMVMDVFKQFNIKNPIKGYVLIDPFGLDLYSYLTTYKSNYNLHLQKIFGNQAEEWKKVSPYYSLETNTVPCLVFVGSKSYPPIIEEGKRFVNKLNDLGCCAEFEKVEGKGHKQMILQMFFRGKPMYDRILSFMKSTDQQTNQAQLSFQQGK